MQWQCLFFATFKTIFLYQRHKEVKKDPLQQWSAWRTVINNELGRDLARNTYKPIPVGEEFDRLVRPSTGSQHGVYHYSTAIDQGTQLHKEDYVNFGNVLLVRSLISNYLSNLVYPFYIFLDILKTY